jgi:hypothetical protein
LRRLFDADTARRRSVLTATAVTSSLWPAIEQSSAPLAVSQTLSAPSRDAEIALVPSIHCTLTTSAACPLHVRNGSPLGRAHKISEPSVEAESALEPSSVTATARRPGVWLDNERTSLPVVRSQIFSEPSEQAETALSEKLFTAMPSTGSR